MKNLMILCEIAVLFMTACTKEKTRDFIPGTYTNHAEGEFSIANDTLIIDAIERNNYIIYRKTGFQKINNGKPEEQKYETEQWQAIYDEATQSLVETNIGKQLTFYPDKEQLMLGKRTYSKIK